MSFLFHLIATVVWIGGLTALSFVVEPITARLLSDKMAQARLLDEVQKRFQPLANISLVVLLLTGMVQLVSNANYRGMLQFDNVWSQVILFKHVAVVALIGLAAYVTFALQPARRRLALLTANGVENPAEEARLKRTQARLTRLNLVLMALVLVCTAMASAQ